MLTIRHKSIKSERLITVSEQREPDIFIKKRKKKEPHSFIVIYSECQKSRFIDLAATKKTYKLLFFLQGTQEMSN